MSDRWAAFEEALLSSGVVGAAAAMAASVGDSRRAHVVANVTAAATRMAKRVLIRLCPRKA
jgi:hypothetical protein